MADRYVSPNGTDQESSGSIGSPYKKISYAESQANEGDTIWVREGNYYEEINVTTKNLTIKNYPGEYPVVDGRAGGARGVGFSNEGLPNGAAHPSRTHPTNGVYGVYNGLVDIMADGAVWDGIDVIRSRGQCIRIFPPNSYGKNLQNVTVKNCTLADAYMQNLLIGWNNVERPENTTIENVTIYNGGMWYQAQRAAPNPNDPMSRNWPSGITCAGARGVFFKNVILHDIWGEGILFDSNDKNSIGLVMEGCVFYDCFRAILAMHGGQNIVIDSSIAFHSTAGLQKFGATPALVIKSTENINMAHVQAKNIVVSNSVFQAHNSAAVKLSGNAWFEGKRRIENVRFYNNTIISASGGIGFYSNSIDHDEIYFYNNVIAGNGTLISGSSAGFSGINHGNNFWGKTPEKNYLYDAATDMIDGSGGNVLDLINENFRFTPTSLNPESYKLKSTSDAIGAGAVLNEHFTDDYYGNTRGAAWDIGFHERDISDTDVPDPTPPGVTADLVANTTSGSAPLTVNFTNNSTAQNGATIDFVDLDFGDGTKGVGSGPWSHQYINPGTYYAVLTVRDTGKSISDSESIKIDVAQPDTGGGTGDINSNVFQQAVTNGAATTVIAHGLGETPKACILWFNKATANGTPVDEIYQSIGFSDGTNDGCLHILTETGVLDGDRRLYDDCALIIANIETNVYVKGTVSWDATNITITWSTTTPTAGTIQGIAFSGSGTSSLQGKAVLGSVGLQPKISTTFRPDLILFASVNQQTGQGRAYGTMDIGVATAANQIMVDHYINGSTSVEHRSEISSGTVVKYCGYNNYRVAVDSIESDGFILNITNSDANEECIYLALAFDGARVHASIEETGTEATTVSYPTGFAPQVAMLVPTPITTKEVANPSSGINTAGIGFCAVGSSAYSSWGYDKPGATVSDSHTMKDEKLHVKNGLGTTVIDAVPSLDTPGVSINYTTAPSTSCFFLLIAVESSAENTRADFSYYPAHGTTDTVFEFTDLSSGADAWLWEFTGPDFFVQRADQNPTISFPRGGVYNVSLTAINTANNDSDTVVRTNIINVTGPLVTVDFSVSPLEGNYPLDIRAESSVELSGGVYVTEYFWQYALAIDYYPASDNPDTGGTGGSTSGGFDENGATYRTSTQKDFNDRLTHAGSWHFELTVKTNDGQQYTVFKEDYVTVNINAPIASFKYSFDSVDKAPIGVQFTDLSDLKDAEIVSRLWVIDGTTIYSGVSDFKHYFETPGTYEVTLFIETEQGTDSYQLDVVINDRDKLVVGYSDPQSLSSTSDNAKSLSGHTHFIPSSSEGGNNIFVNTDDNGKTRIDTLGVGTDPAKKEYWLNRDWATPLSARSFIKLANEWAGLINPNGSIQIAAEWELKLHSENSQIIPRRDRANSLGTRDFRWWELFVSQISSNMLLPQERISALAGLAMMAPSAILEKVMSSTESKSYIFLDVPNFLADNDVLLVTNGIDIEFMKAEALISAEEPIVRPGPPVPDPDEEETDAVTPINITGSRYQVYRDITSIGKHAWKRGDVVINLGRSDSGFFEWYSTHSLEDRIGTSVASSGTGSAFVYNKRTGSSISYSPIFVVGQLMGYAQNITSAHGVMIGSETGTRIEVKDGNIYFYNLPTSDPGIAGVLYNESGTLKLSSG